MEPGDALLFGPHLIHRSVANTSNRIRYSVDCRWFGGESPALRQFYDVERRQVVRVF
jgi:ectoine hydroxylase-related dioxygenase (phytanoyl-CoA dioxygenase family)